MSTSKLEQKAKCVNLVLTHDKLDNKFINDFKNYLTKLSLNVQYAFILHDKDVNKDTGEVKTKHLHCVLMLEDRKRLITIIRDISKELSFNINLISIEKVNDLVGSIQYLIHRNDKEKYQYNIDDIVYQWNDKNEFLTYIEMENNNLSLDRLVNIVDNAQSYIDIMQQVGMSFYRLNRNIILDICKSLHKFY